VALIHDLQLELNEMGAMVKVLPHLARPSDQIAKEVLAFICLSLFNANEDVQVQFIPLTALCNLFSYT